MKTYQAICGFVAAKINCEKMENQEWFEKWQDKIDKICDDLPNGSGIDCDYTFDFINPERLIFYNSFHVMDENGFYDGYIDYTVKVLPSLQFGFKLVISGKFGKYQDIKDYLYEIYDEFFNQEYSE